jgi:hypothetical protein
MRAKVLLIVLVCACWWLHIGCDDSESKIDRLIGGWEREVRLSNGGAERWELTLYEDKTFEEERSSTRDIESRPFVVEERRYGNFELDERDVLVLDGDWLELDDEGGTKRSYAFHLEKMVIFDADSEVIYMGPDMALPDDYLASDYEVLYFSEEDDTLWQRSAGYLEDEDGNVAKKKEKRLNLDIIPGGACTGWFSYSDDSSDCEETELAACSYEVDSEVEVETLDGGAKKVKSIRLEYSVPGWGSRVEFYMKIGSHFLGYESVDGEETLIKSAYRRNKESAEE